MLVTGFVSRSTTLGVALPLIAVLRKMSCFMTQGLLAHVRGGRGRSVYSGAVYGMIIMWGVGGGFDLVVTLFFPFLIMKTRPPGDASLVRRKKLRHHSLDVRNSEVMVGPCSFSGGPSRVAPIICDGTSSLPLGITCLDAGGDSGKGHFKERMGGLLLLLASANRKCDRTLACRAR